jgi:hypothetical protein
MLRHSHRLPLSADETPKDVRDAADHDARRTFVALADALPGGRKSLGTYALRATLAAKGRHTPTPSDWLALAAAGANPHAIVSFFEGMIAAVTNAAPRGELRLCVATVARETGEMVGALVDAMQDDSPDTLRRAQKEIADVEVHLGAAKQIIGSRRRLASQAHTRAVSVLRSTVPSRAD